MKSSRREILLGSLGIAAAGPTLLIPKKMKGYSKAEAVNLLSPGNTSANPTRHDLPTPSLLLDLDALDANIEKMSRHAKESGIKLRPHAKSHKCAEIAKLQIRAGAVGVCAATIREAEAMAEAGVKVLLITCEMVGREKIDRLVRLTRRQPDTISVVDNPIHAQQLSDAANASRINLNVMIDIDPAMRRTGIPAGERALALAEKIMKLPNLKLRGIQAYSGSSAHVVGYEARRAHSEKAMAPALETLFNLKRLGMPVEIMSGGSTGTYNIDASLKGMTELQVGSYVFMDVDYRRIGGKSGDLYEDFLPSLTVIATVVSQSHPGLATVDAGIKAFATDRRFGPDIKGIEGVSYHFAGDEHGMLELKNPSREIRLGDRLEFTIPHCDPTVNLYDRIYGLRGDKVEAIWPVARGHA